MHVKKFLLAAALAATAGPALAEGREPGSVLVFPFHRSAPWGFTLLSITNVNTDPALPWDDGGSTNLHFQYVNTIGDPTSGTSLGCTVFDRVESLTPADTLTVVTGCHNVSGIQQGYVVVSAQDPALFKTDWKHDYLIGSEIVVTPMGRAYTLEAIPFRAGAALLDGDLTDLDGDGAQDYNGFEYELPPDELYIDSFAAATLPSLTLLDFTSGPLFTTTVQFDVWNDNEFALSATTNFRCWTERRLADISPVFTEAFLANNTPNDPLELNIDCYGDGDLETGWARVRGKTASSYTAEINNPSLLGAITGSPIEKVIFGGRLLWESQERGRAGAFVNYSSGTSERPGVEVAQTVYLGHDAGASAPGTASIAVDAAAPVTFVLDVTNTGDVHLGDLQLAGAALGTNASDWTLVDGALPLAPLGTARFVHEAVVDADVLHDVVVTANPVSPNGIDLLGTYSVQANASAEVERFHPAVSLEAGVYLGHDGGARAPGYPAVYVAGLDESDLSYVYTVTNVGDSHLTDVTLEDFAFGVTDADMTSLSGTLPLAPGESLVWLYETHVVLDGDVLGDARADAVPADASGAPRPAMSPVSDTDTTAVNVGG